MKMSPFCITEPQRTTAEYAPYIQHIVCINCEGFQQSESIVNCMLMVVYHRVNDYGGDIYHKSKACAGDHYTTIDENKAKESGSRPCKVCLPDASI